MKQAIGESLSALMDQQADDLDLQRVLNDLDEGEELRRRWQRYHLASAAMRHELDEFAAVDLTAAISDKLPREEFTEVVAPPSRRFASLLKPLASVAVAASVTAVIFGGAQVYDTVLGEPVAVPLASVSDANGDVSAALAVNRSVGFGGSMLSASSSAGLPQIEGLPQAIAQEPLVLDYSQADAGARNKLNTHLQSHLENASLNTSSGMMPFARAAHYQGDR